MIGLKTKLADWNFIQASKVNEGKSNLLQSSLSIFELIPLADYRVIFALIDSISSPF